MQIFCIRKSNKQSRYCYDSRWLAIHCKHEAPFPPFCLERDTLQQKVVIKLMQECKWALDELSN